jgi:hypothetical protein
MDHLFKIIGQGMKKNKFGMMMDPMMMNMGSQITNDNMDLEEMRK